MPSIPSTIKNKSDKFVEQITMIFVDPEKIEFRQNYTVQKGQEGKTLKQILHMMATKWGIVNYKCDYKYINNIVSKIKLEGEDYKTGVLTLTINVSEKDSAFKQLTVKQRTAGKK